MVRNKIVNEIIDIEWLGGDDAFKSGLVVKIKFVVLLNSGIDDIGLLTVNVEFIEEWLDVVVVVRLNKLVVVLMKSVVVNINNV